MSSHWYLGVGVLNKFKRVSGPLSVLLIMILSIPALSESNNIIPQAAAASSTLTVTTQDSQGHTITGYNVVLTQGGTTVASGFSPVTFTLTSGTQYSVSASSFGTFVFDHWLDTGSTVNPRPISITANTVITAVYRISAISLNPTSGPTGTSVTVTGSNFATSSGITVTYDNTAITTNPATVTTTSTGSFSATITVPASTAGGHTVSATDASSNSASAQFTVTTTPVATITLNPTSGPAGTSVTVTGSNFAASSAITIKLDGTNLTTTPTNITTISTGSFTASVTIPSSATAGAHTVSATDASGKSASASFTVTTGVAISLYPASANVGSTVKVTGNGFAANSKISIYFDSTLLAYSSANNPNANPVAITTDSTGGFVAVIQVLDSTTGVHAIKAIDQSSHSATQSLTVMPTVLLLSPLTGHAGTTAYFRGSGFAANSAITISFDSSAVTTSPSPLTSDSIGEFQGSFTVSSTATVGAHSLLLSDASGNKYSSSFAVTSTSTPMFSVQNIVTGLGSSTDEIDGMAFIPDNGPGVDGSGAFMVLHKSGTVVVVKNTGTSFVKQSVSFVVVPTVQGFAEDAGLLGIAIDPNWVTTKQVYFYATVSVNGVNQNEVVRYTATTDSSGNIIADTTKGEKLILGGIPAGSNHNAGHMKFDSQGNLYITTGDNFQFTPAQDLTSLAGKMLRITPLASPGSNGLLYSIPSTNPFATSSSTTIKKEIYSYGLRNPFTFDIDSQTGLIYINMVGYNTWETVLDSTTPANLGWAPYEGPTIGNPQNLVNYKEPIYWYPHSGQESISGSTNGLIAITGAAFYHSTGTQYPSQLQGAYFFGDYATGFIAALLPTGSNPPQMDTGTGVPKAQVQTIMTGLSFAPIDMSVWNGKLYYVGLEGNIGVLNYS